jgi:hypothetical protein
MVQLLGAFWRVASICSLFTAPYVSLKKEAPRLCVVMPLSIESAAFEITESHCKD